MSNLPEFTDDGLLPPQDFEMTLEALRESPLVLGFGEPRHEPNWDSAWRERLVDNLAVLVKQLWEVGITEFFADGSFAESKDHPNDIDGYFHCDFRRFISGDLERDL